MSVSSNSARRALQSFTRPSSQTYICASCRRNTQRRPATYASRRTYAAATASPSPNSRLRGREEDIQDGYKAAEVWDGLQKIGHLGHWKDVERTILDQYVPFAGSVSKKISTREQAISCLHQAIVETSLNDVTYAYGQPLPESPSYSRAISSAVVSTKNNEIVVTWPSEDEAEIIRRLHRTSLEDLRKLKATNPPYALSATILPSERPPPIKFTPLPPTASESLLAIPLTLTKRKQTLTILKRFTQLSGHLIPDPLLQSSLNQPLSVLIDTLTAKIIAPPPAKLAHRLQQSPTLTSLPNMHIVDRRWNQIDRETAVGRWKVIEAELTSKGLPLTQMADVPWKIKERKASAERNQEEKLEELKREEEWLRGKKGKMIRERRAEMRMNMELMELRRRKLAVRR